jgi:PAS domain S-box-containing protein
MNNFQVGTSPLTGNPLQFTHILLRELEEGVATLNHNDQITYCNAAFEQLVHKPAQAIHGFLLTDLFPDAGLPEIVPVSGYRQQLAGYPGSQLSLQVVPIPAEEARDTGGKLVILKKTAHTTGSPLSPQLSGKILNASPALVAVYETTSGGCVYVNQAVAHALGYQPDEWTASGPDFTGSLLHADDTARVIADAGTILRKLHEGEMDQTGSKPDLPVFRIRQKTGDWKWLQVACIIPERDTAGRLQQVAVVLADITDSKNAGEKMIRNEAMLAQAQAAAGFGLWEYYVADSRMEWSDEMYRIYGYQPGEVEVSLQLYARVLHPDDWPQFNHQVKQIIRDHQPYTAERRIFRPDGTMRYLISRMDLVKDDEGNLLKVIGFTVDVTDLKHARQELSEKGHFIGRITDTIPDILYIYDIKQQQNVYANRRLPEVLGFPVEEVQQMGDRFLSLFTHTDDFPKVREGMEKLALASDTDVVEVEYRIMDPQGKWHWFFDRATVFSRDPDGSVRQVLGSSQDVTERRLAQEQLAESEYFIKQVADASPDGLYVYDLQQEQSVYSNRQIYQKLGYTEDEFYAMGVKTTEIITHPEDLPRRREHFEKLRRMPDREVAEIDYRVQTTTGTWLWVHSRDSVFKRTAAGEPWQVLGIVQDITDRKRGAEELRYKNHLIGLILSGFPLILSRVSKEGILLEATGSGLRSMGLAENQLVGINMLSQYPDIAPYIREVMKGNKATFLSEMEVDGEKKYFQNYYFYDQEQNCAVGFSVDVTEQKEAEEKLAESRQFIEQITSAIPQIIYVFDLIEGRNIYINREVNTSLGYSPEQVIGMESNVLVNLQPPEEREMVRKHFERVIAMPDQVHELEYRMKDAAGNWRWFYSRDILFKATPEGQPWQILGSTQDITAIEMRVQESEQLLRESLPARKPNTTLPKVSGSSDALPILRPITCTYLTWPKTS